MRVLCFFFPGMMSPRLFWVCVFSFLFFLSLCRFFSTCPKSPVQLGVAGRRPFRRGVFPILIQHTFVFSYHLVRDGLWVFWFEPVYWYVVVFALNLCYCYFVSFYSFIHSLLGGVKV